MVLLWAPLHLILDMTLSQQMGLAMLKLLRSS